MTGTILNVEAREGTGTGSARAVRREGKVPGIIYGGSKEPLAVSAKENELLKSIRSGKFVAHMVEIDVNGETQTVIPKAIQWHPVTDRPVHFDLYRVDADAIITVAVPVHFKDQEACPGLKKGGVLNVVRHEVSLDVQAGKIPEEITISLKGLEIGHVVHVSNIKLPAGARPHVTDRDFTIATLAGRGPATEETEEAAATTETTEVAEG